VRSNSYLTYALVTAAAGLLPLVSRGGDASTHKERSADSAQSVVDGKGNLHVPANYRLEYEYLGSWAVAADPGSGSKEIHVVFASPKSADAYKRQGHFPNGTVLVKEVFEAATASMTTGTVSHPEKLKGWFVMVRGPSDRYPGNSLWGDGWGWAWFDASDPARTTSTDYRTNCRTCHVPAQASEWIYVSGYTSLGR
jgi:Cytochrome P460